MYAIDVTITGVAPLLFNRWTAESQEDLLKNRTGGKHSTADREAEALAKAYSNDKGLYYPAQNVKKCLLQGASKANLKEGRKGAMPFIQATVFVQPSEIPFGVNKADFIHSAVGRRPPRTGGACVIQRPALKEGWKLSFTLAVFDDRRDDKQLREAMEQAGLLAGLGDWRPEFGRFLITDWKVKK